MEGVVKSLSGNDVTIRYNQFWQDRSGSYNMLRFNPQSKFIASLWEWILIASNTFLSFLVQLFILHYSCIVPVYVMVLLVDVHSDAIVLVKPPYRLIVLCQSYLECPTGLTYIHLIAIMTRDFIYHHGLFLAWNSVLYIHQGLSNISVWSGDKHQVDWFDVIAYSIFSDNPPTYSKHRIFFSSGLSSALVCITGWGDCEMLVDLLFSMWLSILSGKGFAWKVLHKCWISFERLLESHTHKALFLRYLIWCTGMYRL